MPIAKLLSTTTTCLRFAEHLAQLILREGPIGNQGHQTDGEAVGAHFVDGVLDRAVDRAHRDHDHLGVFGAIGGQQTT